MSEPIEDSARPAKRARLDDGTAPTLPADTSAPAPQAASTPAIDNELEREIRAGITEYVCPDNLGFSGVLKQRYTDFLVNEIGLNGQVLHLMSTEVPKRKKAEKASTEKKRVDTQEAKIVLKEENVDTEMVDVQNGTNGEQGAQVKAEGVAAQDGTEAKQNGDKAAEEKGDDPKPEAEEELASEDRETLHSIFGEDVTKQVVKLVRAIRKREHRKAKDFTAVITPPMSDKEKRAHAHQSLRRIFPNLLESSMEEDQTLRIKAAPPADRKGNNRTRGGGRQRGEGGGQSRWEELGGEFLHFNLYKENKDTMEVVGFLGSKLGGGTKPFGFAGTKDRRACTVQRVCVKRQTAERMVQFNKTLFNSTLGDWEYSPYNLKLGDLVGNEFTITLRDCHFQGEEGLTIAQRHDLANTIVAKAISGFSEKGFVNYYGLQRFGSFANSTDTIGRKMLQDDLAGAVADLLQYSDTALAAAEGTLPTESTLMASQDDRNRAKALHAWHTTGQSHAALHLLPKKFTAERNMIQHLSSRNSRNGQHDRLADWQGALMTIPRNLRLMYVHAYQSLVWNTVAGKRWATYGDKVVAGDLVLVNEHRDKEEVNPVPVAPRDIDDNGEVVINPTGSENANAGAEQFERARALSAEEAASGKYTIWDVVLPQPGYDIEYPANDIGAFYKEFMGSEKGGGLDPQNMRRGWREVSLSGGYRKFLARPLEEVGFEVRGYGRGDEQFVETDLERLRKGRGEGGGGGMDVAGVEDGEEKEEGNEEKKMIAVVLKLQLASSQYATIALRELMKAGGVKAYKPEFMGGR